MPPVTRQLHEKGKQGAQASCRPLVVRPRCCAPVGRACSCYMCKGRPNKGYLSPLRPYHVRQVKPKLASHTVLDCYITCL